MVAASCHLAWPNHPVWPILEKSEWHKVLGPTQRTVEAGSRAQMRKLQEQLQRVCYPFSNCWKLCPISYTNISQAHMSSMTQWDTHSSPQ